MKRPSPTHRPQPLVRSAALAAALALLLTAAPTAAAGPPSPQSPRPETVHRTDTGAGPGAAPIELTLADALEQGLATNLRALLADDQVTEAEGDRRRAVARLLPQLSASLGASRQKINLEAFGFPPPEGESPLIGPFHVVDARLRLSHDLLDASALAASRAAADLLEAARADARDARDRVVSAVADLYLGALAADARIEAARAELDTAEAVARLASDRRDAGSAAGIDVLRAGVARSTARQRLIEAENDAAKSRLALARAVGLPLDRPLHLVDAVPFAPLAPGDLDATLEQAESGRADLDAARAQVAAAEASLAAARRQRLPRLEVDADYGPIGSSAASAEATYSLSAGLRLPLFEGGRIAGDVAAARGRLDAAEARLADLKRGVELEVRTAYLDVAAAARRVAVADEARDLAAQQLTQADDRFAAGVAGSLEVTQAQEDVAAASERYLDSLYDYNRAKVALALALGVAEESAASFLKGDAR